MHNALTEKILQATDIISVISERVALVRKGREYVGLCPFHPDKTPSLQVNPSKQLFKCFSCGVGGNAIGFVKRFHGIEYRAALAMLAERAGIPVNDTPADREAARRRTTDLSAMAWAAEFFAAQLAGPAGAAARAYVERRGLTPATVERFRMGLAVDAWDGLLTAARRRGIPEDVLRETGLIASNDAGRTYDRFRHRLMFTIADGQGRPIAFGGRALADDPAKYLNSPESPLFSKSRVLYAFDLARRSIEKTRSALIVEGYVDAVMLHQFGFENAVATLGTALTDAHVQTLRPIASTIYMCFDSDDAGARAADRAVEIALRSDVDVRVVMLAGDKDPADALLAHGREAMEQAIASSVGALEFKWRRLQQAFGDGIRGRKSAVESFLQFVAGATASGNVDPLTQTLLIDRLADLMGVPSERVFDLMRAARAARLRPKSEDSPASDVPDEAAIPAPPEGLRASVEMVLGMLATHCEAWSWITDDVLEACGNYGPWQQAYSLLLDVHQDVGEYSFADVDASCTDDGVRDLLDRARRGAVGIEHIEPHFKAAVEALSVELNLLRAGRLRERVRPDGAEAAMSYDSLLSMARSQHAVLPPALRWANGVGSTS